MMTMTDGVLLDKNGNPVSTAAPVHHPRTHTLAVNRRSEGHLGSSYGCSLFFPDNRDSEHSSEGSEESAEACHSAVAISETGTDLASGFLSMGALCALRGGRRVPLRNPLASSLSSAMVRLRVLRCMPKLAGGFALIAFAVLQNRENEASS